MFVHIALGENTNIEHPRSLHLLRFQYLRLIHFYEEFYLQVDLTRFHFYFFFEYEFRNFRFESNQLMLEEWNAPGLLWLLLLVKSIEQIFHALQEKTKTKSIVDAINPTVAMHNQLISRIVSFEIDLLAIQIF